MGRPSVRPPVSSPENVGQESTSTVIARQLREAVAGGEFQPGQKLTEASLAARYGVSRGPLREAMQRLTQEGLLVGHRNRGLFVMELDEPTIRDIYLARSAVERAATRRAVDRGATGAEALLEVVDAMRAYADHPADPAVSGLDMRFHELLVDLSGSPRLVLMHGSLIAQVRLCLAWMQGSYDTVDFRVTEHADIAEAILAGDADLADRLLVDHMDDGLRRLLEMTRG